MDYLHEEKSVFGPNHTSSPNPHNLNIMPCILKEIQVDFEVAHLLHNISVKDYCDGVYKPHASIQRVNGNLWAQLAHLVIFGGCVRLNSLSDSVGEDLGLLHKERGSEQ